MGLLDVFNSDEGRMALGLLAAAGPSSQPMSFGQRLAGAMSQHDAYLQHKQAAAAAAQDRALKQQMLQAQMADVRAQQQQREAQARQLQQAAQRQQAFQGALSGAGRVGVGEAMAQGGGPTPQAAQQLGQAKPVDWNAMAMQFPDQVDLIKKLAEANTFGRQEVARTLETVGPDGRPVQRQLTKFGDAVGQDLRKPVEMKLMNLGGSEQAYDPYALQQGQQFKRTQTPDGAASNAVAWANFGLAKQRAAQEAAAPKGQYDAERGVMIDPRTAQATPVMMGGQPLGPKDKNLPVDFTKSVGGLKELANGLDSYTATLKSNGGVNPLATGKTKAALQASYTSLQMGMKNAFELGALAGPDLSLLQGMLVDPTSPQAVMLGDKGVAAQLDKAREYLRNRGRAVYEAHRMPVPSEYQVPSTGGVEDLAALAAAELARRQKASANRTGSW